MENLIDGVLERYLCKDLYQCLELSGTMTGFGTRGSPSFNFYIGVVMRVTDTQAETSNKRSKRRSDRAKRRTWIRLCLLEVFERKQILKTYMHMQSK